MTYLTAEQIQLLLRPIHPQRVLQLKGLSYVEGYDIRAELNRIFGFGRWTQEILEQTLICETEVKTNAGKPAWYVVYRSRVRLEIMTPDGNYLTRYEGSHAGESTHPVRGEAHGNALTNSETYALRRCAINLGDQFGLGLYNKGSLEPIVRWTLVRPDKDEPDTDDVPQVSAEEPWFPEPQAAPRAAKTTSRGKSTPEPSGPLSAEEIATRITAAVTVEQLRAVWREAGAAGALTAVIPEPGTGEKIIVQDLLYRKKDELSGKPKRDDGAGSDPGTADGDQR